MKPPTAYRQNPLYSKILDYLTHIIIADKILPEFMHTVFVHGDYVLSYYIN